MTSGPPPVVMCMGRSVCLSASSFFRASIWALHALMEAAHSFWFRFRSLSCVRFCLSSSAASLPSRSLYSSKASPLSGSAAPGPCDIDGGIGDPAGVVSAPAVPAVLVMAVTPPSGLASSGATPTENPWLPETSPTPPPACAAPESPGCILAALALRPCPSPGPPILSNSACAFRATIRNCMKISFTCRKFTTSSSSASFWIYATTFLFNSNRCSSL
mmetsp:Transcript_22853/g.53317  ORF Transcript_22853/g.53317 Transcript_22853/m.53317 type:complete len:217 (+) Transcript_22853:369-1019(+)